MLIVELHRRLLELYGQIASFVLPEESASDAFIVTFLTALRKLWAHAHTHPPPFKKEILQTTSLSFFHLFF